MNRARWPLVALALLLLLAPEVRAEETAPWEDPAFLEKSLAEACDLVEKACGATYPQRPTLKVATRDEVTAIVRKEMDGIFRKLGASDDLQIAASVDMLGQALVAKYEPATNVIHFVPETLRTVIAATRKPELLSRDTVRVLLIHEATHALDFQRFPELEKERQGRETAVGIQAVGAVVEGHAQFVAERVAKEQGLAPAFEAFTTLILTGAPTEDPAERILLDVVMAEVRFAYERGHAFIEAVHAARGRKGVEAVMRAPPKEAREIEDPKRYLDPDAQPSDFDPDPVVAAVRKHLEQAAFEIQGPLRFKQVQLQAAYALLGEERVAELAEAYDDGRMLVARKGDGFAAIGVLAFDDARGSALYAQAVDDLLREKDKVFADHASIKVVKSEYSKGVGNERKRPGLISHKELDTAGLTTAVFTHCGAVGRVVIEMSIVGLDIAPGVQDAWMEAALAALPAAKAPAPADE